MIESLLSERLKRISYHEIHEKRESCTGKQWKAISNRLLKKNASGWIFAPGGRGSPG
jgi:hypothetical protein